MTKHFVILLGIFLTACGAIPTLTPTLTVAPTLPPTNTPSPAPTATPVPPTLTPTPSPPATAFTPAPPTPTPIPPVATMRIRVNVRQGPGAAYPKIGELDRNVKVIVVGKSEDGKWYQVPVEGNKTGWIAADFVDVTGELGKVPVIAVQPPPASPTPMATRVITGTPTPKPTATQPLAPPSGRIYFVAQRSDGYSADWFPPDNKEQIFPEKPLGALNSPSADLNRATNAAPFDWSSAADKLVYVLNDGSQDKLRTDTNTALDSHLGISSPRWSPDGSQIVYIGMDSNFKNQSIYLIYAEGGNRRVLLPPRGGEQFKGLAWSRKNEIAFVSDYQTGRFEIWTCSVLDCAGTVKRLTNDNAEISAPAWSPDGNKLAYVSNKTAPTDYQIYIVNADGTNAIRLGKGFTPAFSPDGNWLAFSDSISIFIMTASGASRSPALTLGTHPTWAP